MPALTPAADYAPLELRRLALRVKRVLRPTHMGGRRLVVSDLHPHILPAHYTGREHVHSYYEGHIVLAGHATYTHGQPQRVGPGASLLHGPRMPHSWRTDRSPCPRLLFWFTVDPPLPVTPPERWPVWPDVLLDIALLLADLRDARIGWEDRATHRVAGIVSRFLTLAEWPAVELDEAETEEEGLLGIVEHYFRDNLDRLITLADVADHAGLSPRSLSRHFRDLTGGGVMDRLQALRMDRAADLLADPNLPIPAVASRVGFRDPSYFTRAFRAYHRTTPAAFRSRLSARNKR